MVIANAMCFRGLSPLEVDDEVFKLSADSSEPGRTVFRAALAAKIRNEQCDPRASQKVYLSSSLHAAVEIREQGQASRSLPCFMGYEEDSESKFRNFIYIFVVDAKTRMAAQYAQRNGQVLSDYGKIAAGPLTIEPNTVSKQDAAFPLEMLGDNKVLVSWSTCELKEKKIQFHIAQSETAYPAYRVAQVMKHAGLIQAPLANELPEYEEHRVDLRLREDYYFLTANEREKFEAAKQLLGNDLAEIDKRLGEFESQIKNVLLAQAETHFKHTKGALTRHAKRIENFNKGLFSKYVVLVQVSEKDVFNFKAAPLGEDVLEFFPEGHAARGLWQQRLNLLNAKHYHSAVEATQRALGALLETMGDELRQQIQACPSVLGHYFKNLPLVEFTTVSKLNKQGQVQFAGTLNMPAFSIKPAEVRNRMNGALERLNLRFCANPAEQEKFCQRAVDHLQAVALQALTTHQAANVAQEIKAVTVQMLLDVIKTNYVNSTSWRNTKAGVYRSDFVRRLVEYLNNRSPGDVVTLEELKTNLQTASCFSCRLFGDAKRSKLREQALQCFDGTNKDTALKSLEQNDQGELVRASDRVLSAVLGSF